MFPPGLIDQFRKMQGAGVPTMSNHMLPAGAGGELPVGMAPLQQPLPGGSPPGQALQPFMTNGPYGLQALRLAGLLGGAGTPGAAPGQPPGAQLPVMGRPYTPGLFMPGFRPGIDQPRRGRPPQGRLPIRPV
jgi:hypothetical protein